LPANIRPSATSTVRVRWLTYVLPHIEQGNFKPDLSINWHEPANRSVFGSRLAVVECPSAPNGAVIDGAPDTTPAWASIVANGDYGGFYGVDPQLATLGLVDSNSVGVDNGGFSKTVKLTFGAFTDGLSNTIALAESAGRPNIYRGRTLAVPASGNNRINGGGWCRPASELFILRGSSADGLTFPGPVAVNATNGELLGTYPHPYYNTDGTSHIYSFHTGGANVLLVDGTVRFLQQGINIRQLAALVSRNSGDISVLPD